VHLAEQLERLGVEVVGEVAGEPVARLPGAPGGEVGAGTLDRATVVLEVVAHWVVVLEVRGAGAGRVALGRWRGLLAVVAHSREYAACAPKRRRGTDVVGADDQVLIRLG
jgi:hypothetical protein